MKNILALGVGLMFAGFFWALLNDSWSYFTNYTPPAGDVFYVLMMMVWYALPWVTFIIGIILVLVSARGKSIMEADE